MKVESNIQRISKDFGLAWPGLGRWLRMVSLIYIFICQTNLQVDKGWLNQLIIKKIFKRIGHLKATQIPLVQHLKKGRTSQRQTRKWPIKEKWIKTTKKTIYAGCLA